MKTKHAFTLVELLVVIGIIALLIAILLPALSKARVAARIVVCGSNLRQVAISAVTYSNEYDGFFPPSVGSTQGQIFFDHGPSQASPPGKLPYGMAILAATKAFVPQALYSPDDIYNLYGSDETLWLMLLTQGYISVPNSTVRTSYVLREPPQVRPTMPDFQQLTPAQTVSYAQPFKPLRRMAMMSDRFMGSQSNWSFHGGNPSIASSDAFASGNGTGWHVGFSDGSVIFIDNDPKVYYWNNTVGAAKNFATRYRNWLYWDKIQ